MHAFLPPQELPTNLLETFALMQHHGAPTRLVDFTHSAYVACFFAIENAIDDSANCAIWAIDQGWCKHMGAEVVRKELSTKYPEYRSFKIRASTIEPEHFKTIFYEEKLQMVLPVEPYRRHTRLTIQQGLFLCQGDVNKGLEGNFDSYSHGQPEKHVVKIKVPNALRVEILTDLNYMNINRATLFPGIDGFAQSLHHSILWLEDHGQINRRIQKRAGFGAPFN